mgnify:CR=1 FL=1
MKLSVSASRTRLPLAAVCDLGSGDGVSPQAARHTVSRRGIEIIIGKEALGRILGNDFSVKEQRADIGVLRRKFDIMRNGEHRHSVEHLIGHSVAAYRTVRSVQGGESTRMACRVRHCGHVPRQLELAAQ